MTCRRRPRGVAALVADVQALSASDRNRLLAAVAALALREYPRLARELNIALDGDEPGD